MNRNGSIPPPNLCTYQMFDPDTLMATNDETRVRMEELGRVLPVVKGKSVLDIGCNGGMATLMAAKFGASRIRAVDVNAELVETVKNLTVQLESPVLVERRGFWELHAGDRSDVVLALEVVHWVVHQGAELGDIARKLRQVTGGTLFVETPWDVTEPSIQHKSNDALSRYSARDFIEQLIDSGFRVEVLHFSRYFGGASKRVMLQATPAEL